ncbi:unnamed protein product [Chrysoparadoxa australica]
MDSKTVSDRIRARIRLTDDQAIEYTSRSGHQDICTGLTLLVLSVSCLSCTLYATVVSALLPSLGELHPMLAAMRDDHYYSYLLPLTIVPYTGAMYLSWVSLKFFRTSL